jgi:hypothetical protein
VKYAVPHFPREQINAAGRCLIDSGVFDVDLDEALAIINNWRAAHLFPMTSLNVTLRTRARKIDTAAIVAQRLKGQVSATGSHFTVRAMASVSNRESHMREPERTTRE